MAQITTFKELREAVGGCKQNNAGIEMVDACFSDALEDFNEVLLENPTTEDLFKCNAPQKMLSQYAIDLAEIAEIGSFDIGDITEAGVFQNYCGAQEDQDKEFDQICVAHTDAEWMNETCYIIKHGGTDPPEADMMIWSEAQLIARTVGEEIPAFVWGNPRKGRFAMMYSPGRSSADTGNYSWDSYPPHEIVTSAVFEILLGDDDRNPSNVLRRDHNRDMGQWQSPLPYGGTIEHIDITQRAGDDEYSGRRSALVGTWLRYLRKSLANHDDIRDIEEEVPGTYEAIIEARNRWLNEQRPALEKARTANPYGEWEDLDKEDFASLQPLRGAGLLNRHLIRQSQPKNRWGEEVVYEDPLDMVDEFFATVEGIDPPPNMARGFPGERPSVPNAWRRHNK